MAKINSRAKGAAGEREFIKVLAEWLGEEMVAPLKRNLEQTRAGGHDIVGLDGWAIEVKRYKELKESDIRKFWEQAVDQANRINAKPVLAYREDMRSWRVRIAVHDVLTWDKHDGVEWTIEVGAEAFCAIVREQHNATLLHKAESPATLAA